MKEKKLNIIMFNMSTYSDWEYGISNRNRHILKTLLKSDEVGRVVAIDYLPWTWPKVVKQYVYSYLPSLNKHEKVYKSAFTSVRQYDNKLTVISSVANYFSKKLFWSELKKIIKDLDLDD